MANQLCVCNNGLSNTGLPGCAPLQQVVKKVIFVQLASNAGVLTSVDPGTTLNKAWMTLLLNNTDKSQRFFPTPEIKNVDTPKDAPVFQKFKDDSSLFVRESVRKFKGTIPACPPLYKATLESVRCNNNTGVYLVDIAGNLIGLTNFSDSKLYPIPVNAQSIVGNVIMGNDDSISSIDLEFEFPAFVQDAALRMITANAFPDFTPLTIAGLLNVNATLVGSVTDTQFVVKLTTPSPAMDVPIAVQGLTAANFVSSSTAATSKVYDSTDATDKSVTVVENPAGTYTVTYASITGKTLTPEIVATGYDCSNAFSGISIATP